MHYDLQLELNQSRPFQSSHDDAFGGLAHIQESKDKTMTTATATATAPIGLQSYAIDVTHSDATFAVRHLITKVRGRFSSNTLVAGTAPKGQRAMS